MAYGYGTSSTVADSSPRDDITRTLLSLADPPPGGIHMPPGGIPPAQGQQPAMGGATPPSGMGQQMTAPVGGMLGQMPQMQPAAFGTAPPPSGAMGPIGGPFSPNVRLPGIMPQAQR